MPSDLSDFCLYGGLYRHVNLSYLPAVAIDTVHIVPTVAASGKAEVSVKATLYNPAAQSGPCAVAVEVLDSRNVVRFSLAGGGTLLDNLGTSQGSRELQLYNGRAEISVKRTSGCTLGITSEGLPSSFLKLS